MQYQERTIELKEYQGLRHAVGWWDVDDSIAQQALENSLYSIAVVSDETTVGMGRVIGDGIYYYIQDLIIHPIYQSKGIGSKIMRMLLNYINTTAKHGAFVGLMAAKGLEEYYKEFGFQARPKEGPGMYYVKQ